MAAPADTTKKLQVSQLRLMYMPSSEHPPPPRVPNDLDAFMPVACRSRVLLLSAGGVWLSSLTGQQLGIYRLGEKIGQVRVSGPAWETYTVADIVEGEIWVGDEARLK